MKWSENMAKKKMTEKEKQDWEALYFYVKNLMGYDENQALSSTMVLRLKGLLTNKFMENGNIESTANYSYEVILNTFKFCKLDIERALKTGNFKDEQHKFNYVLKIVEKNINTVYIKMKGAKKAKEEIETVDVSHTANYVNTFKSKEQKKNDKLEELW
jgi:hypothetical protein